MHNRVKKQRERALIGKTLWKQSLRARTQQALGPLNAVSMQIADENKEIKRHRQKPLQPRAYLNTVRAGFTQPFTSPQGESNYTKGGKKVARRVTHCM